VTSIIGGLLFILIVAGLLAAIAFVLRLAVDEFKRIGRHGS
jgi:hypothetical protein